MTTQTVNIAPTWEATARMMLVLLKDGTEEGKKMAREEIINMGRKLDEIRAAQEESK